MLSVLALEHGGITPWRGDSLVTGANGGVGSIAIVILSGLGYRVIAFLVLFTLLAWALKREYWKDVK